MCSRDEWAAWMAGQLPEDGEPISGVYNGCSVTLWRCRKLTSQPTGMGERVSVLTGGVQLHVGTPFPEYGPGTGYEARLKIGWTAESLARRIATLIERAESRAELDRLRDSVHRRFETARNEAWFAEEWEAEAWASDRPPFPEDMSEADCRAWLLWLDEVWERVLTTRPK